MNRIRLRMKLDKGKRGIALEKLENIVTETTKFLVSITEDLKLDGSIKWVGTDFRNGSLSYNVEYPIPVPQEKHAQFNAGVAGLLRHQRESFLRPATALRFYGIAKPLEGKEKMGIGLFQNGTSRAKWVQVTHDFSGGQHRIVTKEQYVGSAQGTVHSWFKEADEPHFFLRESLTDSLIKCVYKDDLYRRVADAVQMRDQIVHVHGLVTADLLEKTIQEIRADNILTPKRFTVSDYMAFVHPAQ